MWQVVGDHLYACGFRIRFEEPMGFVTSVPINKFLHCVCLCEIMCCCAYVYIHVMLVLRGSRSVCIEIVSSPLAVCSLWGFFESGTKLHAVACRIMLFLIHATDFVILMTNTLCKDMVFNGLQVCVRKVRSLRQEPY